VAPSNEDDGGTNLTTDFGAVGSSSCSSSSEKPSNELESVFSSAVSLVRTLLIVGFRPLIG
jgi:hypothetical protein